MAFDVIITQRDGTYYDSISAGTLFSTVEDNNTYYLKLAEFGVEDTCGFCNTTDTFYEYDACVNIRTGELTRFSPMTECIVYTQSELRLTR